MPSSLLIVDHEEQFLKILAARLEAEGFQVTTSLDAEQAISFVEANDVDVVVLGDPSDGKSLLGVLREIKRVKPLVEVILLAARISVEYSIQAMKLGARDCLPKPTNISELVEKIKHAGERGAR